MNGSANFRIAMICATVVAVTAFLTNAGPLSPPGGPVSPTPGPEPRIAVNSANTPGDADSLYKITQPGSYYLAENVVGVAGLHGIEIAASGVTLDLMGFDLQGVAGSLNGVFVSAFPTINVDIHSGSIRQWSGDGVNAILADNSSLRDLRSYNNIGDGLVMGSGIVDGCTVRANGGVGIFAGGGSTVSGNRVESSSGDGIFASVGSTVSGNTVVANGGAGILASSGCTIIGNTATSNAGIGISAGPGATVQSCVSRLNTSNGIQLDEDAFAVDCLSTENGADGIHCFAGAIVERCTVIRNQRDGIRGTVFDVTVRNCNAHHNQQIGINLDGAGCMAVGNSSYTNVTNYFFGGIGMYGPIVNNATMLTNTNPSINYGF